MGLSIDPAAPAQDKLEATANWLPPWGSTCISWPQASLPSLPTPRLCLHPRSAGRGGLPPQEGSEASGLTAQPPCPPALPSPPEAGRRTHPDTEPRE